jgi:hypothetical protein
LAAAIGVGLTIFAAIKLSERTSAAAPLVWLGPLILTLVIFSGFCLAYSLIKLQWQFDLLNRYLDTNKGGQWHGTGGPPIHVGHKIPDAWTILKRLDANVDDVDCDWPHGEKLAHFLATALALLAAVVLFFYLWIPAYVWWNSRDETPTQTVKTIRQVQLDSRIFFEPGSSDLSRPIEQSLRNAIKAILPLDKNCVLVQGHTDLIGTATYNLELGRMRTERVQSILESEGVPRSAILTSSYGETRPSVSGNSREASAQNRRVEISVASCPR